MVFWPIIIVGAIFFVVYANGANDNFKGDLFAWLLTLPIAALMSAGCYCRSNSFQDSIALR